MAAQEGGLILPAAASLVDQLDKKVLIILRDGRNLVGVMRSFDQFSNVVLEDTYERRVVIPDDESQPAVYGDVPLGLYVIRGDSVVLLGEVAEELEASEDHPRQLPIEDVVALEQSGAGATAVVWDIEDL
ncbi:deadenylation-dependent decapping of nuclear-transcribed mRNA [Aureococcus anophagefferens]|nr:deadenylation-dependent decapping of nuclear-transcribed mRNA [Aureococcus anophagefferens]KAH8076725.1 deadenylation-dependent decapping of nuclear-transcribed mRNA [Aureococcus anophagefferens]